MSEPKKAIVPDWLAKVILPTILGAMSTGVAGYFTFQAVITEQVGALKEDIVEVRSEVRANTRAIVDNAKDIARSEERLNSNLTRVLADLDYIRKRVDRIGGGRR